MEINLVVNTNLQSEGLKNVDHEIEKYRQKCCKNPVVKIEKGKVIQHFEGGK